MQRKETLFCTTIVRNLGHWVSHSWFCLHVYPQCSRWRGCLAHFQVPEDWTPNQRRKTKTPSASGKRNGDSWCVCCTPGPCLRTWPLVVPLKYRLPCPGDSVQEIKEEGWEINEAGNFFCAKVWVFVTPLPTNSHIGTSTPGGMMLEGGASGRSLGREGGISSLSKRSHRTLVPPTKFGYKKSVTWKRALTQTRWHPALRLAASRMVRVKFLLFLNYPVYSILL